MPTGVIDDLAQQDVSGVLERYAADVALASDVSDQVIAQVLQRYGPPPGSADRAFAALDAGIAQAASPSSKLLLGLVRQLAQRGLVDLEALLRNQK